MQAQLRQVRRTVMELRRTGVATPDQATGAGPSTLAAPADLAALEVAVLGLELLGRTTDGKQIRVGRLEPSSPLLHEIGRLRELTFRAIGEGTGRSLDVDAYDGWYDHIVLWDGERGCIAGAYRVVRGAQALARHGLAGLYTASLFRYADDAMPRLAAGMELGRSFVAPEYWGGRSIDYLWQGIGAYLARYPNVRYLFGAVSISAALPEAAREQIVAYYARYYGAGEEQAQSVHPFRYRAAPPTFDPLDARFLAFGVDPDFGDAVDGLIEVDVERMRPRKRERYLGSAATTEAA